MGLRAAKDDGNPSTATIVAERAGTASARILF
jgi:hypothetical protein